MTIQIRSMRAEDVEACGRICHEAFKGIAEQHNFRPDFPDVQGAIEFMRMFLASPDVFDVVAESGGKVIGSNHLWEYDEIRAVGPITVDPNVQAKGVGRMLMETVIERGQSGRGIRLVQDSFNTTSLSLYATLGFDVKEPLALLEGSAKGDVPRGFEVRPITEEDYEACAELCRSVHGISRINEVRNTPPSPSPFVALRDGRVVAYMSAPQFWPLNHAVAETEADMRTLIAGVSNQCSEPLSFLLATRQTDLFRWCLKNKMRVIKPMTLMTMGEYHEPRGCYLPSVGY